MSRNLSIALVTVFLTSCGGSTDTPVAETSETTNGSANPQSISPEPFVAPEIEGFSFPLDEATISSWTADVNGAGGERIALHAWGIWAGLTTITDQTWNGQRLRTYETWETPVTLACDTTPDECPATPRPLTAPGQLSNSPSDLAVTVSYDPTAADYLLQNHLIDRDTLNGLQGQGTTIGRVVMPNNGAEAREDLAGDPWLRVIFENEDAKPVVERSFLDFWPDYRYR